MKIKINFVYDFFSLNGKIVNGINPIYTKKFFDNNFDTQNHNFNEKLKKENDDQNFYFWVNAGLYEYSHNIEICVSNIKKIEPSELYFYPISTNGDLHEFVADRQIKHKTSFFYISEKTKKLLREESNFFIYIEHAMEPDFNADNLNKIYELCSENDIPFNKIFITNGSNSNKKTLDNFIEKYNVNTLPKLVSYNWSLGYKALDLNVGLGNRPGEGHDFLSTFSDIDHINLKKTKKGLLLTRRLRLHRIILLSMLFESSNIDNLLYSLDMDLNFFPNFKDILNYEPETMDVDIESNYKSKILKGYDLMVKQHKKIADYELLPYLSGLGRESKQLYEQTFFTIVQETMFSVWEQSFTEKVLQPIAHFHPFLVIGSPYTLKALKEYGFKTFSGWWDESYDNEEDNWKRLLKVYKIIVELCNKSDDELHTMLIEMKDLLEYNRNLLQKFDSTRIENGITQILPDFFDDSKKIIKML